MDSSSRACEWMLEELDVSFSRFGRRPRRDATETKARMDDRLPPNHQLVSDSAEPA